MVRFQLKKQSELASLFGQEWAALDAEAKAAYQVAQHPSILRNIT